MKILKYFIFFIAGTLLISCGDDDKGTVNIARESDFVWKAMNSWYLWQSERGSILADSKDDNINTYAEFLASYSTPEALFEDLRYQPDVIDRFSFMTDDYEELQNSLQGIDESFGFNFQALRYSTDKVLAVVRYVLPNSPAENAGLKRGDIIISVNGQVINLSNYFNLLYEQKNVVYTLGEINNGTITPTANAITMSATIIDENPVFLTTTFSLPNGKKAGYLVYNQFTSSYNDELNDAFAYFQAQGITDLILDLRYNPGGSVLTATYLGSMIYTTSTNKTFAAIEYNSKHSRYDGNYTFNNKLNVYNSNYDVIGEEPITSLGLSKVYVLTSTRTASASELIINGLKPYIDVELIGMTTTGKNVGSITLYDSPNSDYLDPNTANTTHKYALQPLVSRLQNSSGFSDYTNGFAPDVEINELDYLGNYLPLGDENEPLLAEALDQICTGCRFASIEPTTDGRQFDLESVAETGSNKLGYNDMTLNELFLQ